MLARLPSSPVIVWLTSLESAAAKTKETIGIKSGEATGKASEMTGQAKGKASEVAGEAKGKASELKGEAKSKM